MSLQNKSQEYSRNVQPESTGPHLVALKYLLGRCHDNEGGKYIVLRREI